MYVEPLIISSLFYNACVDRVLKAEGNFPTWNFKVSEVVRNFHPSHSHIYRTQRVITKKKRLNIVHSVMERADFTKVYLSCKVLRVFAIHV